MWAKLWYSHSSILMPSEMLFNWELLLLNMASTWCLLLSILHAYDIVSLEQRLGCVCFTEHHIFWNGWITCCLRKIAFLVCLITAQVVYHVFWDKFLNLVLLLFWLPHVLIVKLIFCDNTQKAPLYKSKVNILPYLAGVP